MELERLKNLKVTNKKEVNEFISSIKEGRPAPISFEDIYYSTRMSFDIIKSIRNNETILYI